jgi:O-antigen ligase
VPGNSATYRLYPEAGGSKLSPLALILLLVAVGVYFICGQLFLPVPVLVLCVAPIVLFAAFYLVKAESTVLALLVLTLTLIQLKSAHGEFTVYDALVGAFLVGTLFVLFIRRLSVPEKYTIGSTYYILFILYVVWISAVGIANLLFAKTTIEWWLRDLLLLSPLLIVPALFLSMDLTSKRDRRIFFGAMVFNWILCFFISVVRLRASFLEVTYLFEVSYSLINGLNGPFMLIVFFNLFLVEKQKKRARYYLAGIIISIVAVVLVHNRTFWIVTPIGLLLSVLTSEKAERRKAYRLFFRLTFFFLLLGGILYLAFPILQIMLKLFIAFFLSSSNVRTDASLIGRYIEWRHIWSAIQDSPIIGYGVGSTYHTYNWFGGYFYDSGYTHNGYLGVLQRGGIIGFILLFSAYLGFIKKGWGLMRSKLLTSIDRALLRSGVAILVLLLLAMNTANLFSHRDILMYIGLIWGYILYLSKSSRPELELREAIDRRT